MAEDVVLPKYGMTMEEATLGPWEVEAGARVEEDQPLVSIHTDKVDTDIEAPVSGTVVEILVEAGATVDVGTVLCRIEED